MSWTAVAPTSASWTAVSTTTSSTGIGFWSDTFWTAFWATAFWGQDISDPNTWGTVGSTAATYTAVAADSMTYTAVTRAVTPPPWGLFSPVTGSDCGVDFILRAYNEMPMYASDDRPLATYDLQPEGQP